MQMDPKILVTESQPSLLGITVLVVDDDLDARELLKRVLERREASGLVAARGGAALGLLRPPAPGLIVLRNRVAGAAWVCEIPPVRVLAAGDGVRAASACAHARS